MSNQRPELPDFERPPVVEVVLSVQFEPLAGLRVAHMGLLWSRFRDRFPATQEHSPILSIIEEFGSHVPQPRAQVEFMSSPSVRLWFIGDDGHQLIQVQADRFARNWRGEGEHYPRYESIRDSFQQDYETFTRFLADEGIGRPKATQAEVTYVNHILSGDGWVHHGEAHKVFSVCIVPEDRSEPEREDFGFALRYAIENESKKPVGRLHVSVSSASMAKDQRALYVMQLTARGRLDDRGDEGVFKFHDLGREWIVRRFAALTTPAMHRIWGRRDA